MQAKQLYKQSGMTLIIGLIFMVLMSIVGLAAMNNSTVQEQINGNTVHKDRAFLLAEEDLASAEQLVLATNIFTQAHLINVIYDASLALSDSSLLLDANWDCTSSDNDKKCLSVNSSDGNTSQVKVEYLSDVNNEHKFRLSVRTARGRSRVLLQSIFIR